VGKSAWQIRNFEVQCDLVIEPQIQSSSTINRSEGQKEAIKQFRSRTKDAIDSKNQEKIGQAIKELRSLR
jgi:hypothetical protein